MQSRCKLKRFLALLLTVLMVLACMPMTVMAEEPTVPDDGVSIEVIPDESGSEPIEEPAYDVLDTEPEEQEQVEEIPMEEEPPTDPAAEAETPEEPAGLPEETQDELPEDKVSQEPPAPGEIQPDEPADDSSDDTESDPSEQADETPADDRHPLKAALDTYGHVYVATVRKTGIYSSPVLKADTLVYTTTSDIFLVLATGYTEHDTVVVWFLDEDENVVKGFVSLNNLDDQFLLDDEIDEINYLPLGEGMTSIGMMGLFVVNGSYPEKEDEHQMPADPIIEIEEAPILPDDPEQEELEPVEMDDWDALFMEPEDDPEEGSNEDDPTEPSDVPEDLLPLLPEELGVSDEEQVPDESAAEEPAHANAGDYIRVTTKTRVFGSIDLTADETYYSSDYQGSFVKDATVQVLSVSFDENGGVWYQVRFLYGDDFADGRMKWTDYSTAWIKATETEDSSADSCTVTDFAYTLEYLKMTRRSGAKLLSTTPMDGFTLKKINGQIGSFYAWQQSLYGSSGHDSDYPQIAKSAAHGLIYATPHYLEGFTVFCLEHKLSGPGEGSGSSQTAKGPYVLVDMDTFVNDPNYGGTTGVRFKASTMHALGWVLRHTYPFMALNRTDSNNEVWSRVAGQFAMREVIKQMEGAQYVRDYWDMDNFYSFSGGAPAVYLTYARWLAENGIAHGRIVGNITASNQSLSVSGSNYIGTVKLTTDADLIRIPKSVGTLTGNSGGSDSDYYYVKSGDTIKITSTKSKFTVTMESIASDDEEANFLVGVPSVAIQKVLVPLYGHPNKLKSASLDFELSLGEIQVTKKASDGTLLKGAVFELLNSAGTVIATATTNAKGIATFASLQPGSYTVREKTPPQGFKLAATSTQKIMVTAGNTATATFTNAPVQGKIRIIKTDTVTGKPLAGVVFTVTRLTGPDSYTASDIGKVVATITTNADGIAETGLLPWGQYKITETGVLNGYLDAGYTTTVTIK